MRHLSFVFFILILGTAGLMAQNQSIQFDGINDYGTIDYPVLMDLEAGTVECWFQMPTGGSGTILCYGGENTAMPGFELRVASSGIPYFRWHPTGSAPVNLQGDAILFDTWVHLAVGWDANGMTRLWQNGIQRDSLVFTPGLTGLDSSLQIARQGNGYGYAELILHSLRVSQNALYSDDFAPPLPFTVQDSTAGLWLMDEGSGSDINDSSVNAWHGTVSGATWIADAPVTVSPDFTASVFTGDHPLLVQFTDLSTSRFRIIDSWAWDFNNDGTIDSNAQNPFWTYAEPGVYSVSLTVSDGNSAATELKTDFITVTNNPPIVQNQPDPIQLLEDTQDSSIDLNTIFIEPDSDPLGFDSAGSEHLSVEITGGVVTFTPALNWNGTETVQFTASDPWQLEAHAWVEVTVTAQNDPPQVGDPINELVIEEVTGTLDLSTIFFDPDLAYGDQLTYDNAPTDSLVVTIEGSVATIDPTVYDFWGMETVSFTATDLDGQSLAHAIDIYIVSPEIANVSVYPNPFSPDFDGQKDFTTISFYTGINRTATITIFDEETGDIVFVTSVEAFSGWNQYVWDGYGNQGVFDGVIVPDAGYGLLIQVGSNFYECDFTIKVDTQPPVIDIISSFPNPFSPNQDGYQDFHQVRFRVDDVIIRYVGLIRVNLWKPPADTTITYIPTQWVLEDGVTPTTPDVSVFDELTDGGYLFVMRLFEPNPDLETDLSPGAQYILSISGNGSADFNNVEITQGNDLYKLGDVAFPWYTVGTVGADDGDTDEDNNTGLDFLRCFIVEGNASFNVFFNDGQAFSLNNFYDGYFGDLQNVVHPVHGNLIAPGFQYSVTIPGSIGDDDLVWADGRYIYRIIVTDQAMHAAEESGELLVNNYPIQVVSQVEPPVISPANEDGYYDQSVIHYQVSEEAYVTVKMWDAVQDSVVKILRDNEAVTESGYVIWDGTNQSGEPVMLNDQGLFLAEITATDQDIHEDVVSVHQNLTVDNIGPEPAEIFLLGGDTVVTTPELILGGISNDIGSTVLLYVNDQYHGSVATTPQYPGYFEFPVTLEEGYNDIFIRLRDQAWNLGGQSNTVSVTLDSSPPNITVLYPNPNQVIRSDSIRVRARISDAGGSGVNPNSARFGFSFNDNYFSWQDAQQSESGANTYYYDLLIPDEESELLIAMLVTATDSIGNVAVTPDSLYFTYRAVIPPEILSRNPADSALVNALPQVSLDVLDNEGLGLNLAESSLSLRDPDGNLIAGTKSITPLGEDDTYRFTFTPTSELTDGLYTSIAYIRDGYADGISAVLDTIHFTYDHLPPTIGDPVAGSGTVSSTIDDGVIVNHAIAWISMPVTEPVSELDTQNTYLRLYDAMGGIVPGSLVVDPDTLWWMLDDPITVDEANAGSYSVRYLIADIAGNQVTDRLDFILAGSDAPQVTQRDPGFDSMVNQLTDGAVWINFTEAIGITTDPADTYIILHGPSGNEWSQDNGNATLNVDTSLAPHFVMSLTPDVPLSGNGVYQVEYRVENLGGNSFSESYPFTLDTLAPDVSDLALGLENSGIIYLEDGDEIGYGVLYCQATLNDNFTGNLDTAASSIGIWTSADSLLNGTLTYLNQNQIRYTLEYPLKAINRYYTARIEAADLAGNVYRDTVNFRMNVLECEYIPEDNSAVNEPVGLVSFIFTYDGTVDADDSTVQVVHPDGDIIEGGSGGTMQVTSQGDQHTMTLHLNQALGSSGEDDGRFHVSASIVPGEGDPFPADFSFVFDTMFPYYDNLQVGGAPLIEFDNGELFCANDIDQLSVTYMDSVMVSRNREASGVDFAPNMTKLILIDATTGQIVDGTRHHPAGSNTVSWTLNQTVTGEGDYIVRMVCTDRAGNQTLVELPFHKVANLLPEVTSTDPATSGMVNRLTNDWIELTITDYNGVGLDPENTSISLQGPVDSWSDGNGAVQSIVSTQTPNQYQVRLALVNPLQTNGAADGAYTVTYTVTDQLGGQATDTYDFLYDTQRPLVTSLLAGDNSGNTALVYNQTVIAQEIHWVEATFAENGTGSGLDIDNALSTLNLYRADGSLVAGTRVVIPPATLRWDLGTGYLEDDGSDDGAYFLIYSMPDMAGNLNTANVVFSLQNPSYPQVVSTTPAQDEVVAPPMQTISAELATQWPINTADFENNYLRLRSAQGEIFEPYSGGMLEIQQIGGGYNFTFTLDDPLPDDGSDDGTYVMEVSAMTIFGYGIAEEFSFVYDSTPPEMTELAMITPDDETWLLYDDQNINYAISSVRVAASDLTAGMGDLADMSIVLSDSTGTPLPGTMTLFEENTYQLDLDSPVVNDGTMDGDYAVEVTLTDAAGNQETFDFTFTLVSFDVAITSVLPGGLDVMYVNYGFSTFSVDLEDYSGNGLDIANSWIELVPLDDPGGTISDNQGGTLQIHQNGFMWNLTVTMFQPMETNGSGDGMYRINAQVALNGGATMQYYWEFLFDTLNPTSGEVTVDGVQVVSGAEFAVDDIQTIEARIRDYGAGIAPSVNLTSLSLSNPLGNMIPGTRELVADGSDYLIRLHVDPAYVSPFDWQGDYLIMLRAGDRAGNLYLRDVNIRLVPDQVPQVVLTYPPQGVTLSGIQGNDIIAEVTDYIGLVDDIDLTFLQATVGGMVYEDENGASLEITTVADSVYQMTLSLIDPNLPDGRYDVTAWATNESGFQSTDTSWFVLDTSAPVASSPELNTWDGVTFGSQSLFDGMQLNLQVTGLSIEVTDLWAGVDPSTVILQIYDNQNNPLCGATTHAGDIYSCTASPYILTPGLYQARIEGADNVGNAMSLAWNFLISSFPYTVVSTAPAAGSHINTDLNEVSIILGDVNGYGINLEGCDLYLENSDGDQISDGLGAQLEASAFESNYTLTLALDQPLQINGDDDDWYTAQVDIERGNGQHYQTNFMFAYDHLPPVWSNLLLSGTALPDNGFITTGIDSVRVTYSDDFGVDYALNMTRLTLRDANGQLIPGARVRYGTDLVWRLNQPLDVNSDAGEYMVRLTATDRAGNQLSQDVHFYLGEPELPVVQTIIPADGSALNLLADNRIIVNIHDPLMRTLDENDLFLRMEGPTTVWFDGQYAQQTLTQIDESNWRLEFTLNQPLATSGVMDGTYLVRLEYQGGLMYDGSFVYDTMAPELAGVQYASGIDMYPLYSAMNVQRQVDSLRVQFGSGDLSGLDLNHPQTRLMLRTGDGQLVPGTLRSGNDALWLRLSSPLLIDGTDDGAYVLSWQMMDLAGNLYAAAREFTIANPDAPGIPYAYPAAGSYLSALTDDQVVVRIYSGAEIDTGDFFSNYLILNGPDGQVYAHQQGAVQTLQQINGTLYEFTLTLDLPLPTDGSEDGDYTVTMRVLNQLGLALNRSWGFVYDTAAPEVEFLKAGTATTMVTVREGDILYAGFDRLRLQLVDDASYIVWNTTTPTLSFTGPQTPSGTLERLPNQSTLVWTMDETVTTPGNYMVNVQATDAVGNTLNHDIGFSLSSFMGEVIATVPQADASFNQPLSAVSVTFEYDGEYPVSEDESAIIVHHPDGDSISVDTGAVFDISQTNLLYTFNLVFDQPLSTLGDDDGRYRVETLLTLESGLTNTHNYWFTYDTRPPMYENLRINTGDTLIVIDDGGRSDTRRYNARRTRELYYFTNDISELSIDFRDEPITNNEESGIDFAPNVSRLLLLDSVGGVVDGTRDWDHNRTVSWTLDDPVTGEGSFSIWFTTSDRAGNIIDHTIDFLKIDPVAPVISGHQPADQSMVTTLENERVTAFVTEPNGLGLNPTLTDIALSAHGWQFSDGNDASIDIEQTGENQYSVHLELDQPLPFDAVWTMQSLVYSNVVSVAEDTMTSQFTYDTTAPPLASPTAGNDAGLEFLLTGGMVVNDSLNYFSATFADTLAGQDLTSPQTYVKLYSNQGVLIPGQKVVVDNATVRWQLNETLPVDGSADGNYYVEYSAVDLAGNRMNQQINFSLINPNAPQYMGAIPQDGALITSLDPPQVEIVFEETGTIDTGDLTGNYIRLHRPDGSVASHNNGANLTINQTGITYTMILELDSVPSQNGVYEAEYRIENDNGYATASSVFFTLDNQNPTVQTVFLELPTGQTQISEGSVIYQDVLSCTAVLNDATTDLDFASGNTLINIQTQTDSLVAGSLSWNESQNTVTWTLDEPLSEQGRRYYVHIEMQDLAGNTATQEVMFLLNAFNGDIVSYEPEPGSNVSDGVNQVKVQVRDLGFGGLNDEATYIQMEHNGSIIGDPSLGEGYGAQMVLTEADSLWDVTLELDQPLSEGGEDDGLYEVEMLLVTGMNQEVSGTWSFVYDRTIPQYADLFINGDSLDRQMRSHRDLRQAAGERTRVGRGAPQQNGKTQQLMRDGYYSGRIDSVSVRYIDVTSGISPAANLTYLRLRDENNQIVPGWQTVTEISPNQRVYTWHLSQPIPGDGDHDGSYTINLKATDQAGNTLTQDRSFDLVSEIVPELIGWEPWDVFWTGAYINELDPPRFEAEIKDYFGIVEQYNRSYIEVTFPNNEIANHYHGGDQEFTTTDSSYVIAFELDGSLSTVGEDDGLYYINVVAENNIGEVLDSTLVMIYDTVRPFHTEIRLQNNSGIWNDLDLELNETSGGISALSVKYGDLTSGIYWTPNLTNLSIFDANGEVVPGMLTYSGTTPADSLVTWTLDQPLSSLGYDDGDYTIRIEATDKAGNVHRVDQPLVLQSPMAPSRFDWTIDASYRVHLSWDDYTPPGRVRTPGARQAPIRQDNRQLTGYQVARSWNGNAWELVAIVEGNYLVDDLLNEPDGEYLYSLVALYTGGVSPALYTEPFTLDRFVSVSVEVLDQENAPVPGVTVSMVGNDGLYNMEFVEVTGDDGRVQLGGVFRESYLLRLEKEGFEPLETVVTVSEDPTSFSFVLGPGAINTNHIPQHHRVFQNSPNPFNPETEIRYGLSQRSQVTIDIYNLKGQRLRRLVDGTMDSGYHSVIWHGEDETGHQVASGIYLYVFRAKGETESKEEIRRMILLK